MNTSSNERLFPRLFHGEHQLLLSYMEKLKQLTYQMKQWDTQKEKEIKVILDSFMQELDDHHKLEERLLLSVMTDVLGYAAQPVNMITEEHNQLFSYGKELQEEMTLCEKSGNMSERFLQIVTTMTRLLHDHMHKEEKLLFPMADRLLDSEQKKVLFKAMEEKQSG